MSVGVGLSKTAETVFTKNVFKNYLTDGNQLKPLLGSKFKVATKVGEKITFYITAEVLASKKPSTGSVVQQSKGTEITKKLVRPETYVVATYLDEYDSDSTGLNLTSEIEQIHSRALGLEVDEIILRKLAEHFTITTKNKLSIDATKYEIGGWLDVTKVISGIARGMTKYLVVDSAFHAKLLANEKFINGDYGTSGIVEQGSLDGMTRLGMKVLLVEDLDPTLHGTTTLIGKANGNLDANKVAYLVTEEALCAGLHFADSKSTADKIPERYNALLVQTHMSLGVEVLGSKGIWQVTTS